MRKIKKIMILGLIASMSFGLMACGGKETDTDKEKDLSAKELVENIPFDKNKNFTAEMIYKMDLSLDIKKMLINMGTSEEEIAEAIDNGEFSEDDLLTNITVHMDATLKSSGTVSYIDGSAKVGGTNETESNIIQSYIDNSDKENPITYSYYEPLTLWYIGENKNSYSTVPDTEIFTKYVKSAKITDTNDKEYTLSVIIDLVKLHKNNPETMEEAFNISALGDSDEIIKALNEMEFIFKIEKETNNLLYMSVDYKDIINNYFKTLNEADGEDQNYTTVNEYYLEIKYKNYGKTSVTIPDEVKNTTVMESDIIANNTENKEEKLVYDDKSFTLFNNNYEEVCTLSIPEGFYVYEELSNPSCFELENSEYNSISIICDNTFFIVNIANGKPYEPNLTSFTKDEITKSRTIETEMGNVDLYVNSYIFADDETETVFETYYLLYNTGSNSVIVTVYDGFFNNFDIDYTIDDLAKIIFK